MSTEKVSYNKGGVNINSIVEKAKAFAHDRHAGQTRKGSNDPFTSHLDKVAEIAHTLTEDPEVIAAAWLHDVVEDTDTSLEEVYENFGNRVGKFVALESEDKRPHLDERDSWQARKDEQIDELNNTPDEFKDVFIIALADKLANTTDMLKAKNEEGLSFWNKFNNDNPDDQEWYYRSFANIIGRKSDLSDTKAYKDYISTLDNLFSE